MSPFMKSIIINSIDEKVSYQVLQIFFLLVCSQVLVLVLCPCLLLILLLLYQHLRLLALVALLCPHKQKKIRHKDTDIQPQLPLSMASMRTESDGLDGWMNF
jgi:hypothetical protein